MQVAIYTTIINTENTGLPHFVQALTPVLSNGLCNIQQVRLSLAAVLVQPLT